MAVPAIISLLLIVGCAREVSEIDRLQAQVRRSPASVEARIALGKAYLAEGSLHNAFVELSKAAELDPTSFEALYHLTRVEFELEDFASSEHHVEQALEIRPGDADALTLRGQLYLTAGENEQAVKLFEQALKAQPGHQNALRLYTNALIRADRLQDAEEAAAEHVSRYPDDVEGYLNLGLTHALQEEWEQAEKHLRRAVEVAPEDHRPRYHLAEVLINEGKHLEEALELAEQADELGDTEGMASALSALALNRMGRQEEALQKLLLAARANPRNVRLWLLLAGAYRKAGDERRAAIAAAAAVQAAPRRKMETDEEGENIVIIPEW